MVSPWRAEGEWLRAALHVHSTSSDGELSPRGVAHHYGRAGYDVVALTDLPEDRAGHVLGTGIERGRKAWTNPL